jgi:hypothetical protein
VCPDQFGKRTDVSAEHRLFVLERQVKSLQREAQRQSEWIDTHNTALVKRLWFVIQGYRFRRLGRWYKARWNESAAEWDS